MQNVLTLETNKYNVKIENFEGPLDLLCHLIDKNKIDICDVKLSDITDQYIQHIKEMEKMNLEIASEFLVMASTLLYLKSKSLLPSLEEDEEQELTEDELLRRIIEYKKYKEITKEFKEKLKDNSRQFFKVPDEIELPKQRLEVKYGMEILVQSYKKLTEKNEQKLNQNAKNIEKIAITESYTVGSKVKEMYRELLHKKRFVFNHLFSLKKCNNKEVVTAFTGLLELSRRSKVITEQEEIFGNIEVEKIKKRKL